MQPKMTLTAPDVLKDLESASFHKAVEGRRAPFVGSLKGSG